MDRLAMNAIFLSASVPLPDRGEYYETADPFLIQLAIRELVIAVISKWRIVWGGHPSITPMVWAICEDLGVDYAERVILYQSKYFEDVFPEENARFKNVHFVEARQSLEASLEAMRHEMLSRDDLKAAVFIGGMDGVEVEHSLFRQLHPNEPTLIVASTGGAALQLSARLAIAQPIRDDVDFASMYSKLLGSLSDG